jgi:hypothetical protein
MDTSYSGISEKLSGFEMSNGFRVIEGYCEKSDSTEYRDEFYREISRRVLSRDIVTSFIARYRDEYYRELSRRVLSRDITTNVYRVTSRATCREVPREGLCIARHHERISIIT